MEVSRLIFSKETKDKMNEPINQFKRGELRWKRIRECEDDGTLSKARNRMDIVEMLGSERKYGAMYNWVSNMITRGFVKETMLGFSSDGKMEYEYHTIKSPNFSPAKNANKGRKVSSKSNETAPKMVAIPVPVVEEEPKKAKVAIRYKELTIELENVDETIIERIVDKLADK